MKHFRLNRFIVSAFAIAAMGGAASAYDFEVDGIYYNVLSFADKTCEVTRGTDDVWNNVYSGDIVVPETATINGRELNVVAIGTSAFASSPNLKSVILPESIKEINNFAFQSCISLKSAHLPNSVENIGQNIFDGCFKLEYVKLPENINEITSQMFSQCSSLKEIVLPPTVSIIRDRAFWLCTELENINIDNVTNIEHVAFNGCSSLKNAKFNDGLSELGNISFQDCQSLREIRINNIYVVGLNAFRFCAALEKVTIDSDVMDINGAFDGCDALTDIYAYPLVAPKRGTFSAKAYINATLHIAPSAKESYENAEGWREFWNVKTDLEEAESFEHIVYFKTGASSNWDPIYIWCSRPNANLMISPGVEMTPVTLDGESLWRYSFNGILPSTINFNDGGDRNWTNAFSCIDGGIYDINGFVEMAGVDDCEFVNSGVRAWSEGGVLYVSVTGGGTAKIAVISIDGRVRELPVHEGLNSFDTLPRGIYIVNGSKIAL